MKFATACNGLHSAGAQRSAQKIAKELRQWIKEWKGGFRFLKCFANDSWR